METGKGRSRRQASPRPVPHRAGKSIARHARPHHDPLAARIVDAARTATLLLGVVAAMSFGVLLAWCLMCPDGEPVGRAEWEAQVAAQTIGGAE